MSDDYSECEECFGASEDVRLRHDPINGSFHMWLCDNCEDKREAFRAFIEQQEKNKRRGLDEQL